MLLPDGLTARLAALFPGAQVVACRALGDDAGSGDRAKALGYGKPVRVDLVTAAGPRVVVVHTVREDDFGHDRRADRVGNLLLAYDTFGRIPGHAPALDVGVFRGDTDAVSLRDTGEPYLVTAWCDGDIYANDLRRVARTGHATAQDVGRAEALARALVEIHAAPGSHLGAYARALRDLVGSGEGVFGIVDAYAADTPGAPAARLRRIEEACAAWRWRLRDRGDRLRRTHGDAHPFNVIVGEGTRLTLLDASRGGEGDPADDVACVAINYLFFGLGHPDRDGRGLSLLWRWFWQIYQAQATLDVTEALAPFLAWRGLVLACPRWYPDLRPEHRERLLAFVERALAAPRVDPAWGAAFLCDG
ncbi:MAG: phosphotransferase [Deltaproteobacteria bacterium]|nr:phosphotransferase [Deltaproteobacteria bacterium]